MRGRKRQRWERQSAADQGMARLGRGFICLVTLGMAKGGGGREEGRGRERERDRERVSVGGMITRN